MESIGAGFVTMVMDRLQAMEAANAHLEVTNSRILQRNQELEDRVQALERPLCLTKDLLTFSDGMRLEIHEDEGLFMRQQRNLCHSYLPVYTGILFPLDDLHANALAFQGKLKFDFCGEWSHVYIGEEGGIVSVRQMAQQMHACMVRIDALTPDVPSIFARLSKSGTGWITHPLSDATYWLEPC